MWGLGRCIWSGHWGKIRPAAIFYQCTVIVELCCCPLQDDRDFRDKITPISVVMEFSLDVQRATDPTGLQPLIDPSAPSNLTKQVCVHMSVCLSVCPSIYICCISARLYICLPICQSIHVTVCISIHCNSLSIHLCLSVCVSIYLSTYLPICLSVCLYLYTYLYICLYTCLSICLPVCQSVYVFVYLFVCRSICLSIYRVVCSDVVRSSVS